MDDMSGYDDLLCRCMKKIPKECREQIRFAMPVAEVLIQGTRTMFVNFNDVATTLRRDPEHMLKFFTKELATSSEKQDKKIIFQGRFPGMLMNKKLEMYAKDYVLCPNCCKPDTKLIKSDRLEFIKCEACGNKQAVKKLK
jgi:translation initiation factor 2 subunit 2